MICGHFHGDPWQDKGKREVRMIRRQAQMVTSAPGATPVTYDSGFILGWDMVEGTGNATVIWEDGNTHSIQVLPLTANTFFFLDGCPVQLTEL